MNIKHLLPVTLLVFLAISSMVNASEVEDWDIRFRPATQETIMTPPDLKAGEEYNLTLHPAKSLGNSSVEKWFANEVATRDEALDAFMLKSKTEVIRKKGVVVQYTHRRYKADDGSWRIAFYTVWLFEDKPENMRSLQLVSADMTDDMNLLKRYLEFTFYTAKPSDMAVDPRSIIPENIKVPVANARISSRFGYRSDPFNKRKRMRSGIDFAAPRGTIVRSIRNGKITFMGRRGGYGNVVEVSHAGGIVSRYAHLKRFRSKKNQKVSKGSIIAEVGTTGRSTGPHLHLEVLKNGNKKNPADYL